MKINKLYTIILLLFVTSCANNQESKLNEEEKYSDHQLYELAIKEFDQGNYKNSNKYFRKITQEYPYSKHASQAQFMEGVSHYKVGEYDDAIIAFEEFISLYPASSEIINAYYMKSLCYYDQMMNVHLDQEITLKAEQALKELINRFPDTKYAKDAKIKLNLVYDHLAGKEMSIGRFYLKKGELISAIPRFQYVVTNYQTTPQIEEALYRLAYSYYMLGLIDKAQEYGAVLGKNYPNSKWYLYSYKLLKDVN